MAVAYWFRDGANFDDRCAPKDGGGTANVNTAYKVTSGGALLRDRYAQGTGLGVGPSALLVFGESPFNNDAGDDIAGDFAAINRNCIPAVIPPAVDLVPSGPAFAAISFDTDGRIRREQGSSNTDYPDRWGASAVTGADFQIRFTLLSGSVSGNFGSWMTLGGNRAVSCSVGDGMTQSGEVRAEWRYGSSGFIFSDDFRVEASSGPL